MEEHDRIDPALDEHTLISEVRKNLNADLARSKRMEAAMSSRSRNLLLGGAIFLVVVLVLPLFLAPMLLRQHQDSSANGAKAYLTQFSLSERGMAADAGSVSYVKAHARQHELADGSGVMWSLPGGSSCWGVEVSSSGLVGVVQQVSQSYCQR